MKLSEDQKKRLFDLVSLAGHIEGNKIYNRGTKGLEKRYFAVAQSLGLTEEEAREFLSYF